MYCRRRLFLHTHLHTCGVWLPCALTIAVHIFVSTIKRSWRFAAVMAAVIRLLPAVAVLLYSCPGAGCWQQDVLELGDADFDYLAKEHETMLVKFYAPW